MVNIGVLIAADIFGHLCRLGGAMNVGQDSIEKMDGKGDNNG